jgi:hypothetical protein
MGELRCPRCHEDRLITIERDGVAYCAVCSYTWKALTGGA